MMKDYELTSLLATAMKQDVQNAVKVINDVSLRLVLNEISEKRLRVELDSDIRRIIAVSMDNAYIASIYSCSVHMRKGVDPIILSGHVELMYDILQIWYIYRMLLITDNLDIVYPEYKGSYQESLTLKHRMNNKWSAFNVFLFDRLKAADYNS